VYGEATIEIGLGALLVLGLFRKVAYIGGFFLSLLIWSVGEGFGGPYTAASTDIGAGIIYALGFLFLILVNATYGPSKHSLDHMIERKWGTWKKMAEIRAE
jgi:nitrite reductase (NO-forming)